MKFLSAIILFTFSNFLFSQDYKQKLSKSSCDCLKTINTEDKDKKTITSQFGLCMLKTAMPYSKEIKRDYGIDLSKDIANNEKMKELGIQMGMLMLNECQELFEKITESDKDTENAEENDSYLLFSGTVKKIEKENFVIFHIVGENKTLTKFYWVSNVESDLDLPKEYNALVGKKVNLSYYTTEIFDAKINDYKNLNILSSLKTD